MDVRSENEPRQTLPEPEVRGEEAFFTSQGMKKALEQDPGRYTSNRRSVILDARLGNIMVGLQMCRQHASRRKTCMPQFRERVLVASADYLRQSGHSDSNNAPLHEAFEKRLDETETKNQVAGYSAIVSRGIQVRSRICKSLHRSAFALHHNRVKDLGRASAAHLLKMPPFLAVASNGNTFLASFA